MFPRRLCPRCRRSISVRRDDTIRGHFCPHYRSCEQERCPACQAASTPVWRPDARDTPGHPAPGTSVSALVSAKVG